VVVRVVYGIVCEDNMLIMSSESASDLSSGISRAINGFGDGTGESDDKKSSVVQRSGGRLMMCCGGGYVWNVGRGGRSISMDGRKDMV
jgi:hypothetical protein